MCDNRRNMDPPLHSGVNLRGQQLVKTVQSDQRCKHQQAWFGHRILRYARYFVHWLLWESKNHQQRILYSIIDAFEGRNYQKTATNEEEKCALSPRQWTVSQVVCNDGKNTWIALKIASALSLFSRSGLSQLLAVCRPHMNAPGKEIWLQWSGIGTWDIFWGQR